MATCSISHKICTWFIRDGLALTKRWIIAWTHYNDIIMGTMASQITSLALVYSTVYSDADQRKHQSSASLAFVRGIPRKCFHWMTSSCQPVTFHWKKHVFPGPQWVIECANVDRKMTHRLSNIQTPVAAIQLWVDSFHMMTSSNRNILRVTGPLWVETIGHRWIFFTKASDAEHWCYLWSTPKRMVEQTIDTPAIWDAIALIMPSL